MRSANEVSFMDTLDGANLAAGSAINALFVIYRGEIILYRDSAGGTGLFALSAGNTAVFTIETYLSALVMVVTGNYNASGVSYKMDYMIGAFLYAKTASNALSRLDCSKPFVIYAYCVSWADLDTVAVSKAGECAEIISGVVKICGLTCFGTVVVILFFLREAESVTGNVCHLLDNVLCRASQNFGDITRGAVSAGDAKVCFVCYSLRESLGISITAGKAASAAIGTGEGVAYGERLFILFNSKISRSGGEKKSAKRACCEKNNNGD